MNEITEGLSAREDVEFKACEMGVESAKGALEKAAKCLAIIHNKKLYREKFDSFEEYCEKRWSFSKQRAYQLLQFDEIRGDLNQKGQQLLTNEGQARELSKVPEENRQKVINHASKNGAVTAKSISNSAKIIEADEIRIDKTKREIPIAILPEWDRSNDVASQLVSAIQNVCNVLRKGVESHDLIFREFSGNVVTQAEALRYTVKSHLGAYAVCPFCHGQMIDKCDACSQRGFVSKYFWESPAVPKKMKELIERTVK